MFCCTLYCTIISPHALNHADQNFSRSSVYPVVTDPNLLLFKNFTRTTTGADKHQCPPLATPLRSIDFHCIYDYILYRFRDKAGYCRAKIAIFHTLWYIHHTCRPNNPWEKTTANISALFSSQPSRSQMARLQYVQHKNSCSLRC